MRPMALLPLLLIVACCCPSERDPFDPKPREVPYGVWGLDEQFPFTTCNVVEVPIPAALTDEPRVLAPQQRGAEDAAPDPVSPPAGWTLEQLVRWDAPATLDHLGALQDWAAGRPDGHAAVVSALVRCVEQGVAGADADDDPTGRCLRALALLDRAAAVTEARAQREALRDPEAQVLAATLDLYPEYTEFLDYLPLRGPLSEEDRAALTDPTLLTLEEVLADRDRRYAVPADGADDAGERLDLLRAMAYLVRPELDDALFESDGELPRIYLHKQRFEPKLEDGEGADADTCIGMINTVLYDQGSLARVVRLRGGGGQIVVAGGRQDGMATAIEDGLILVPTP